MFTKCCVSVVSLYMCSYTSVTVRVNVFASMRMCHSHHICTSTRKACRNRDTLFACGWCRKWKRAAYKCAIFLSMLFYTKHRHSNYHLKCNENSKHKWIECLLIQMGFCTCHIKMRTYFIWRYIIYMLMHVCEDSQWWKRLLFLWNYVWQLQLVLRYECWKGRALFSP